MGKNGEATILFLETIEELIKNDDKHTIKELMDIIQIWIYTAYELEYDYIEVFQSTDYYKKARKSNFLVSNMFDIADLITRGLGTYLLTNKFDLIKKINETDDLESSEFMDESDEFKNRLEAYRAGVPVEDLIA